MAEKIIVNNKQENDDYMGVQCFEVNPNIQLKEVPTSGEEYLLKVIKERAKYSSVSKCDLDELKILKPQHDNFRQVNRNIADNLQPTIEWQNIQTADFSDLHMYVIRMAARKRDSLPSIFQETYKDFMIDGVVQWSEVINKTEPTLSHVVGLTHTVVEAGLNAIFSILHKISPGHTIDRRTGLWLHALLSVTRYPPQSDESYILRKLSRKCAEIRSSINMKAENAQELATPLNIFICIIAKYFGQHDLGDYELHDSKVGQIYYDSKVVQVHY